MRGRIKENRVACVSDFRDLLLFLDTIEQECIADNSKTLEGLDKAAERIVVSLVPVLGKKYKDGSYVQGTRDYFSRDELIGLIKAGAQWMAEQGYKQTERVFNFNGENQPCVSPTIFLPNEFQIGDKVIVQIRKA